MRLSVPEDVENQRLPSLCGEALSVEVAVGGQVTQGQTSQTAVYPQVAVCSQKLKL